MNNVLVVIDVESQGQKFMVDFEKVVDKTTNYAFKGIRRDNKPWPNWFMYLSQTQETEIYLAALNKLIQ